jgi:hypothetical protein
MPLTVLQVYLSWDARPHQVCALLQHHGRQLRFVGLIGLVVIGAGHGSSL